MEEELIRPLITTYGLWTVIGIFFLRGLLIGKLIPATLAIPPYLLIIGDTSVFAIVQLCLLTASAVTAGQIIIYYESKKEGYTILKKAPFLSKESKAISRSMKMFKKRGSESIFLGNLLLGVRGLMAIPAGMDQFNFKRFIVFTYTSTYLFHVMFSIIIVKGIDWLILSV